MHLYYYQDPETGRRVYTLEKFVNGRATKSAHPARFSPDDKYSRHRVTLKRRFGLLLTQQVSRYLHDTRSAPETNRCSAVSG